MRFRVQGAGCRVQGAGCRGAGFGVLKGFVFKLQGLGIWVSCFVLGTGFESLGWGVEVQGVR